MTIDLDALTAGYIKLRDYKTELVKAHNAELAKIDAVLEKTELAMMTHLLSTNQESAKMKAGTFFKAKQTGATVASRETFLEWVKANEAWDLVDVRAAKSNIALYKEAHNDIPPGINWRENVVVNVRKGTASGNSGTKSKSADDSSSPQGDAQVHEATPSQVANQEQGTTVLGPQQ